MGAVGLRPGREGHRSHPPGTALPPELPPLNSSGMRWAREGRWPHCPRLHDAGRRHLHGTSPSPGLRGAPA
jgi:hypothetical protein